MKKIKCCAYRPWGPSIVSIHSFRTVGLRDHIRNTSVSSLLENVPNKLECYVTLIWKGLLETNTLVYLAHA